MTTSPKENIYIKFQGNLGSPFSVTYAKKKKKPSERTLILQNSLCTHASNRNILNLQILSVLTEGEQILQIESTHSNLSYRTFILVALFSVLILKQSSPN